MEDNNNEQEQQEEEKYKEIPPGDGRRFIFDTIEGVYIPLK